jgi:chromosome segregation ATPase
MEEAGNQEKLDAVRSGLDADWERLNVAQDDWVERLGNVRGLLRSLAGAMEKHKAESGEYQEKAKAEMDALRAALTEGGGATAGLESRILELEQEVAETVSAAEEQAQRIGELEAALVAAKAAGEEAQAVQQEVAELREAERALKNELATLRPLADDAQGLKVDLETRLAGVLEELAGLRPQLALANEERDEAASKLAALESEGAGAAEQVAELEERAKTAEGRAATRERELSEALEPVTAAERELAAARENHEQALAVQEETGQQLALLQKQLDAERERTRAAEDQVEDEKSKGTKATLAAQLAEALQEAEEARKEARELKRALEQAQRSDAPLSTPVVATSSAKRSSEEELNLVRKAAEAKGGGKFTIGELLVNAGLVTQEQVEEAIEEQKRDRHQHIGSILVRNGWAGEEAVAQALAYQCNVEFVRLPSLTLDGTTTALISARLANQHACIPIESDDVTVTLAIVNPLNLVAIEDIERSTSRKVEVVVATPGDIQEAINKYFWEPD